MIFQLKILDWYQDRLTFLQSSTITAYITELIRATANIINEFVIVVEPIIVTMIVNMVCCTSSNISGIFRRRTN